MFYTVYILYSLKDKRLYVGCASDIEERIRRHNSGQAQATRNRRPLLLIHSEKFEDKGKAFSRERFFKSLWGAREKKRILKTFQETRSKEVWG